MALSSIPDALEAIRRGDMVILVDDEDRENEGDLVCAAEKVTPEIINFMATHGRGLICLTLTQERLNHLDIPMMTTRNDSPFGTAFTVSIEAREGVTTGISASDRARTILCAVDDASGPADLVTPGHIFPLRARDGGVLTRTGQTEGSVDLSRLAGLNPSGVICEILNDDGTMARMEDLEAFAQKHDMLIVSVADLIKYRLQNDRLVEKLVDVPYPMEQGEGFRLRVYRDEVEGHEHLALVLGNPEAHEGPVPVRVTHQNVVGDVFRGTDARCGWQTHGALDAIADAGCGVLVYLYKREASRFDAVRKYVIEEEEREALDQRFPPEGHDVNRPRPQFRDFGLGAQILRDCGVSEFQLISNNQRELPGLDAYGLSLAGYVDIPEPAYHRKG